MIDTFVQRSLFTFPSLDPEQRSCSTQAEQSRGQVARTGENRVGFDQEKY
jgi:hypothetical protein